MSIIIGADLEKSSDCGKRISNNLISGVADERNEKEKKGRDLVPLG